MAHAYIDYKKAFDSVSCSWLLDLEIYQMHRLYQIPKNRNENMEIQIQS